MEGRARVPIEAMESLARQRRAALPYRGFEATLRRKMAQAQAGAPLHDLLALDLDDLLQDCGRRTK